MTPAEMANVVTRFEFRHSALGTIVIGPSAVVDGMLEFRFLYQAPHRDTGVPSHFSRSWFVKWTTLERATPEWLRDHLADEVRACFIHEFEECLHYDGVRIRDPHAGESA